MLSMAMKMQKLDIVQFGVYKPGALENKFVDLLK
jgi:hypothetical protein